MIEVKKQIWADSPLWQFSLRIPYVAHFYWASDGMVVFALCPHYSLLGRYSRNAPAALWYAERVPSTKRWPAFWICELERFPDAYEMLEA